MIPTVGRIVHYTLTTVDAEAINRRRADASASQVAQDGTGVVVHYGNTAAAGQVYPLLITRVWGDGEAAALNGQVFLDGNDCLWVMSRTQDTADVDGPPAPGKWRAPWRV